MKQLTPLLTFVLLASCAAPVTIVLDKGTEAWAPFVQEAVVQVATQTHQEIRVSTDGVVPAGTTDLIWLGLGKPRSPLPSLPSRVDGVFPASWTRSMSTGAGWIEVPIAWDTWGLTRFGPVPPKGGSLTWSSLTTGGESGVRGIVAGATPELRSAVIQEVGGGDDLASVHRWTTSPFWQTDTWSYQESDFGQRYRADQKVVFVESFSRMFKTQTAGFRTFQPLVGGTVGEPAVAGRLLSLSASGTTRAVQVIESLEKVLLEPSLQSRMAEKTGWMAASLEAPVLDSASAEARKVLMASTHFDRIEAPADADLARWAPSFLPGR